MAAALCDLTMQNLQLKNLFTTVLYFAAKGEQWFISLRANFSDFILTQLLTCVRSLFVVVKLVNT